MGRMTRICSTDLFANKTRETTRKSESSIFAFRVIGVFRGHSLSCPSVLSVVSLLSLRPFRSHFRVGLGRLNLRVHLRET